MLGHKNQSLTTSNDRGNFRSFTWNLCKHMDWSHIYFWNFTFFSEKLYIWVFKLSGCYQRVQRPSQEEINSYTVLRTKIFVIRTIHMQNISFLAKAPFQYSLETSVNLQTSWWFQRTFSITGFHWVKKKHWQKINLQLHIAHYKHSTLLCTC